MDVEAQHTQETRQIGPFRVVRQLESCGAREAFLAVDAAEHQVVLKVLSAPQSEDGLIDPRIADEASAYARLSHPNLVKVVQLFSASGRLLVALETVEGSTLNVVRAALVRRLHKLDDACWYYVGSCIFGGLAAAHAAVDANGNPAPILHGNVNPSSVHVAWDGAIKVGDFGVASIVETTRDSNPGLSWGSYGYLAPEQASARPVGPHTDVYSAALVLWELLAGRKAVERVAESATDLLDRMAQPSFLSLDELRPDVDRRVLEVVRAALEQDPAKRSVDAAGICEVLRSATDMENARNALAFALANVRSEKIAGTWRPPPAPRPRQALPKPPPPPPVRPTVVELALDDVVPLEVEPERDSVLATSHLALEIPGPVPAVRTPSRTIAGMVTLAAAVLAAGIAIPLVMPRATADAARRTTPAPEPEPTAAAIAPPAPAPAAEPSAERSEESPSEESAPEEAPARDPVPPNVGELQMPASADGHRIFVDGRTVSEGTDPVRIHCGPHEIRIGSAGRLQNVNVPCGTTLALTR
jgi:eukaryotic-like serine/threonine-protein kinase